MKPVCVAAVAATTAAMFSAPAMAGERGEREGPHLYVAARIGAEIADANALKFNPGAAGFLGAGLLIGDHWRFEFMAARRGTNISAVRPLPAEGSFSTWSHMANGYYHFRPHEKRFNAYAGAGVGYNITKLRAMTTSPDESVSGFGYPSQRHAKIATQGILGVSARATDRLTFDISGAYFTSGDEVYNSSFPNNPQIEAAYRTYSVQFGARWRLY